MDGRKVKVKVNKVEKMRVEKFELVQQACLNLQAADVCENALSRRIYSDIANRVPPF